MSVGSQPAIEFSADGLVLHVRGAILDRVVSKYDVNSQSDETRGAWVLAETWEVAGLRNGGNYPIGITRLETLFRTTTCNCKASFVRWDDDISQPMHTLLLLFLK